MIAHCYYLVYTNDAIGSCTNTRVTIIFTRGHLGMFSSLIQFFLICHLFFSHYFL